MKALNLDLSLACGEYMAVAFFDMDGTLIDGDTNELSLRYFIKHGLAAPERMESLKHYGDLFYQGVLDINTFIRFAVEPLTGIAKDKLQALLSDCVKTCILPKVKPGALKQIDFHRKRGDCTVIVTSTMDYLVEHVALGLGISNIIAAPMERLNGVLTGKQAGLVPYQEGKVIRIREFIAQNMIDMDDSYAYGDTVNDLPMLLMCNHRYAIDPNANLVEHPDFNKLICESWR